MRGTANPDDQHNFESTMKHVASYSGVTSFSNYAGRSHLAQELCITNHASITIKPDKYERFDFTDSHSYLLSFLPKKSLHILMYLNERFFSTSMILPRNILNNVDTKLACLCAIGMGSTLSYLPTISLPSCRYSWPSLCKILKVLDSETNQTR